MLCIENLLIIYIHLLSKDIGYETLPSTFHFMPSITTDSLS